MTRIKTICLSEFFPPSDSQKSSFIELIGALSTAFTSVGIEVEYQINTVPDNKPCLVFGYHRLFRDAAKRGETDIFPEPNSFHANCIPFNLEPLNDKKSTYWLQEYLSFLACRNVVVDYSPLNESLLRRQSNAAVYRFRYGYQKISAFCKPTRQGGVAFFGFPSARRKRILENLSNNGWNLYAYTNVWGARRDLLIGGFDAVINISKHDNSPLECHRIWLLLCLGVPVITERGVDDQLAREWEPYVHFIDGLQKTNRAFAPDWRLVEKYRRETSFESEALRLLTWLEQYVQL